MAIFNDPDKRKPLFRLALLGAVLAIGVIGLGAFTRLVHAGLGCPDWPTCYGHFLWPNEAHEIHAANLKFADTPVETDKTWPEQVHRIFASTLGLIGMIVFALSVKYQQTPQPWRGLAGLLGLLIAGTVSRVFLGHAIDPLLWVLVFLFMGYVLWQGVSRGSLEQPLKLPAFLAGFLVLQGLFGMWTVTLKVWPQVVTLHLLGGFTAISLFWLLTLRLNNYTWQLSAYELGSLQALKPWFFIGLGIVILQIALGGWTTSNYAAVACPDLPTCQGLWWPHPDFSKGFNFTQEIGPNYLGGVMDNDARIAIHLSHRIGAMITFFYVLSFGIALFKATQHRGARTLAKVLIAVLCLQIALGLGNIIFHFPLYVTVSHNAGGALLLLCMVTVGHRLLTAQAEQRV